MVHLSFCTAVIAAVSGLASPALAANATAINSQVRLAYAGATGMVVSWNTFTKVDNPTVIFGLSPSGMSSTANSSVSVTYPTSLTYNNHVKITGLKPDTLYYYMPTTLIKDNLTMVPYTFKTSRVIGDGTAFSVAVTIDMGTMGVQGLTTYAGTGVPANNTLRPGDLNTIESLTNFVGQYDFLWHPGDIAYADAWLKEEISGFLPNTTIAEGVAVYESILNDYYDQMTPVTTRKPYMVGPGNHESNCINGIVVDNARNITFNSSLICIPGQTNFTGYMNHFRMPSEESNGTGNFWYSFDHGMAHFVQLDTETDLGHGEQGGDIKTYVTNRNLLMDAQTKWLEADLAKVNRSVTPWIIVTGHRPWYLSGTNVSSTICLACQRVFEPIFLKHGIDLYMAGHSHVYERNTPVASYRIDPAGLNNPTSPWYITNGAGGHYDGLETLPSPRQPYSRFGLGTQNGSAAYGWSKLTFHNCTHLTQEFVSSRDGKILDSATLFKNRTCALSRASNGTGMTTGTAPSVTATFKPNAADKTTVGLVVMVLMAVVWAALMI